MSERMRGRVPRPEEVTVVLVGDCRVGKTALVTRFCEDIFIQVNLKNFFIDLYQIFLLLVSQLSCYGCTIYILLENLYLRNINISCS